MDGETVELPDTYEVSASEQHRQVAYGCANTMMQTQTERKQL